MTQAEVTGSITVRDMNGEILRPGDRVTYWSKMYGDWVTAIVAVIEAKWSVNRSGANPKEKISLRVQRETPSPHGGVCYSQNIVITKFDNLRKIT